jgi:hypothetical protein
MFACFLHALQRVQGAPSYHKGMVGVLGQYKDACERDGLEDSECIERRKEPRERSRGVAPTDTIWSGITDVLKRNCGGEQQVLLTNFEAQILEIRV